MHTVGGAGDIAWQFASENPRPWKWTIPFEATHILSAISVCNPPAETGVSPTGGGSHVYRQRQHTSLAWLGSLARASLRSHTSVVTLL